jgi:hypothetical protein
MTEQERVQKFVNEHQSEIQALYDKKYYLNGGWYGLIDAMDDVMESEGFTYDLTIVTENVLQEILRNF